MRRSLRMACGMVLGVASWVSGCNKGDDDDAGNTPDGNAPTPTQVCSNVAYDTCTKIYGCASADQLQTLGFRGNRSQCIYDAIEKLGCTSATQAKVCAGAQASSTTEATNCSKQVTAANCTDVATKPVASYAAGCGQCAVRP